MWQVIDDDEVIISESPLRPVAKQQAERLAAKRGIDIELVDHQRAVYTPTPEELQKAAEEIRNGWSERERKKRWQLKGAEQTDFHREINTSGLEGYLHGD